MARIYDTAKSTLALRQRKRFLISQIQIGPDSLRASLVERFSRCGKANCHCHHGGDKHGPFYYPTQCLAVGKMNKFFLNADIQQQAARTAEFTGFFLLGKLIELDKTEKIFTTPSDKRTEDYITGRFG